MHRFHLPPAECLGDALRLHAPEAHHALNVLRLRPQDPAEVLDGAGSRIHCVVDQIARKDVVLKVQRREFVPRSPFQITLLPSILKGKAMDLVIQKATELGTFQIIPIRTERSVSQMDGERAESKVGKWQAIALESIKQCGSTWLPEIANPLPPAEALSKTRELDLALVASLQADAVHPRLQFDRFVQSHQRKPRTVGIWIGPEGDFTPEEIERLKASEVLPISLGRWVLRGETAAIAALSVVNFELDSP